MRPAPLLACAALALLTVASGPRAQATIIVDQNNGPGTQFTDLPPAVAAAAPGDRIIVRPGLYRSFTTNKPLSILGSSQGTVNINFILPPFVPVVIQDLPAGTDFVLRDVFLNTSRSITAASSVAVPG